MSRLTKKDYKNGIQVNGYYTKKNAQRLTDISHKLGKLEDLMEEYNLESIEDLENLLALQTFKVGGRSNGKSIIAKGILYNQLSDELGCPLDVVFKALLKKEGIRTIKNNTYYIDNIVRMSTGNLAFELELAHYLYLKDYGKTWWLKGEKNEKAS